MLHWHLRFLGLCVLCGCNLSTPPVFIPTEPLTEDQKVAIAKEDAETCNCGRALETQLLTGNGGQN